MLKTIKRRTIKYYGVLIGGNGTFWAYVHEPPRKRTVFALDHNGKTVSTYVEVPGCFYQICLQKCNKDFFAITISVLLFDQDTYYCDSPGWLGGGYCNMCLGNGYNPHLPSESPEEAVDRIINYLWESKFSGIPEFEFGERAAFRHDLPEIHFDEK